MKTEINTLEAERQLSNKVMTILLIVMGSVILYAYATNYLNEASSKKSVLTKSEIQIMDSQ